MTFIDNRSPREKLQDECSSRIIDGMYWSEMEQYVYDKLDEELVEDLTTAVKEIYPDYFDETEENN